MKQLVITHFLLNLYLLALLQPALPILDYVINYDYIVSELCENRDKPVLACHGKCYLGDQIELQQDFDTKEPIPVPPKMDFEKIISLAAATNMKHHLVAEITKNKPIFSPTLSDNLFQSFLLRPPQS